MKPKEQLGCTENTWNGFVPSFINQNSLARVKGEGAELSCKRHGVDLLQRKLKIRSGLGNKSFRGKKKTQPTPSLSVLIALEGEFAALHPVLCESHQAPASPPAARGGWWGGEEAAVLTRSPR